MSVLDTLIDAGLTLRADGNRLIVAPASRLTGPMRDLIRAHKTELLASAAQGTLAPTIRSAMRRSGNRLLTPDQGDRCHAGGWDDPEIEAFTARVLLFIGAGIDPTRADDLAERLVLRDRDGDDRRVCLECSWLGESGRCIAAANGRLVGADQRLEPVTTKLQRCLAFGPRKGLR